MFEHTKPYTPEVSTTSSLARAIRRFAQTDGDHTTAIPALTLHRRSTPTEPLHCIYRLGLGVVAQGGKQVMLGGESIDYNPGNRWSRPSICPSFRMSREPVSGTRFSA